MASFPTVLPDQLVASDQRDQLARQAAALGDPTVGYQRRLLASQAARLGDPVAAPATSSTSSSTPESGSGGDLAASPLATSAAVGTADQSGLSGGPSSVLSSGQSDTAAAATSPLTAPSSVDDQRRELAWTAAQLGDPTATTPAAPTTAPSSGTGAPTSFSAPAAGPDLLKNAPDALPGGSPAPSRPPDAPNVELALGTPPAAPGDVRPLRERNLISNQFDYQRSGELSPQEAMSACGPTAALAFARYFGRQPTIGEALGLAKQVGWTPSVGMAGPDSEVALLGRLGVDSRYQPGASAGDVAGEVQAGRPVILDTPNHYYAIDAFDAKSGLFHVGGSGQALRGGSDWMSWAQIAGHGNGVRGAIVVRGSSPGGASAGSGPVVESGTPLSSPAAPTSTAASAPASSSPASSLFGGGFSLPAIGATGVEQSTRPSSTPGPRFGGSLADAGASVPSPSWDQGPAAASASLAPLPDVNATGANAGLSSSEGIPQGIQAPSTGGLRLLPGDTPLSDIPGNVGTALVNRINDVTAENRAAFPTKPLNQYTPEELDRAIGASSSAVMGVTGGDVENLGRGAAGDVSRFFHGTGSAFDRPDAAKFDANGLFGPGYYLTDSPEVASSYANAPRNFAPSPGPATRAQLEGYVREAQDALATASKPTRQQLLANIAHWQEMLNPIQKDGPNVRAVNVPNGLHLLDADAPLPLPEVQAIADQLSPEHARLFRRNLDTTYPPEGSRVYTALRAAFGGDTTVQGVPAAINDTLRQAGYDGIRYDGGKRIPLADANGQPITHNAIVVFPESLGKLTNAISLTQFGGGFGLPSNTVAYLRTALAPAKDAPPAVQSALREWVNTREQALVDGQSWALRAKTVLGSEDTLASASRFEERGTPNQFVANPTPAQAQLAQDFEQFGQQARATGLAHGYMAGDPVREGQVSAFFPHVPADLASGSRASPPLGAAIDTRDFFQRPAFSETIADLHANGTPVVDSASGAMGHYGLHVGLAEADYQFVDRLKTMNPPMAVDAGASARPPGWKQVDGFKGTAFAPEVADVVKNVLAKTPELGGLSNALGTAKETMFSLSGFHTLTLLRQSLRANGVAGVPVLAKAIQTSFSPGAYDAFRLANADLYSEAAHAGVTGLVGGGSPDLGLAAAKAARTGPLATGIRAGVGAATGFASGYGAAKTAGADDKTALLTGLGLGAAGAALGPTVGKAMADSLWERTVPTLKVLTYQLATSATKDPEAAATFVNQTFGGNNLAAIARSPNVQTVIRLGVLAPDWWEGWARQVGGAVAGGPAMKQLTRAYWGRTAVEAVFLVEGLNYAINGHLSPANDPGHQADLELTGLYDRLGWNHADPRTGMPARVYLDVLGPIGQALRVPLNAQGPLVGAQSFVKAHEGLLPSTFTAANSGVDYNGRPLAPAGSTPLEGDLATAGYALGQVAPVGLSSFQAGSNRGEPLPVTALSALSGMRTSRAEGSTAPSIPRLPDSSQQILRAAGLSYKPQPLATSLRGAPMTLPEEERYAAAYVQEMDTLLHTLSDQGTFGRLTPVQRTAELGRVEQAARNVAEGTLLRQIGPAELRRRIDAKNAAESAALTH